MANSTFIPLGNVAGAETVVEEPRAKRQFPARDFSKFGRPEIKGGSFPIAEDFSQTPFIVIWEITQACELACVHCRAEARPWRDPRELSTQEGFRLLDQIRELNPPLFVITGGDPLMRPDVYDFIRYATDIGLRVSFTPSGTRLLTREAIKKAQDHGLVRIAVSLDAPTRGMHDGFRQQPGSFDWTIEACHNALDLGLTLQINTTLTKRNPMDLDEMAHLVADLNTLLWSVFFLVPVGRGLRKDLLTAKEHEKAFAELYEISQWAPFQIKSTEAPHYRRFLMQKQLEKHGLTLNDLQDLPSESPLAHLQSSDGLGFSKRGVNDGDGFVFISHIGEVWPSGFLPMDCGNVREKSLVEIYREHPLFIQLRDRSQIKGKCGRCPFTYVCGGSRARAYALSGDPLASEPCCSYIPPR